MDKYVSKGEILMFNRYFTNYHKNVNKTTLKSHFTPVRMTIIHKLEQHECGWVERYPNPLLVGTKTTATIIEVSVEFP